MFRYLDYGSKDPGFKPQSDGNLWEISVSVILLFNTESEKMGKSCLSVMLEVALVVNSLL